MSDLQRLEAILINYMAPRTEDCNQDQGSSRRTPSTNPPLESFEFIVVRDYLTSCRSNDSWYLTSFTDGNARAAYTTLESKLDATNIPRTSLSASAKQPM